MPISADAFAVIALVVSLTSIPMWVYVNDLPLIDHMAFAYIRVRHGKAIAQRTLFHPLRRYDLQRVDSDGTALAAHGRDTRKPGTPILQWAAGARWDLRLSGDSQPFASASWDDLAGINRLTELLDQPARCRDLRMRNLPEIAARTAVAAATPLTLVGAVNDLQRAVQGRQGPPDGLAQLVRHAPSGKPVGILLTLPESLRDSQNLVATQMAGLGWRAVPLDQDPGTLCLTRLDPKVWQTLAPEILNPKGLPTGHRRW